MGFVSENGNLKSLGGVVHNYSGQRFTIILDGPSRNTVRCSVGYSELDPGYVSDLVSALLDVYRDIDEVLSYGMYALVSCIDPLLCMHIGQATCLFNMVSSKYCAEPGVLYDVLSVPHGMSGIQAKRYATCTASVVRRNSPDALCLVSAPLF